MTALPEQPKFSTISVKCLDNYPAKVAKLAVASLALSLLGTAPSQAATIFYGNMFAGAAQFDSTVISSGNTVTTDIWTNLTGGKASINRGDYSFNKIGGGSLFPQSYNLYGSRPIISTSGQVVSINPSSRDVLTSRLSGIEFKFTAPVNGLGFEVGDWATCCQPSALYISFDNGTPIQVGNSTTIGDQFLTNDGAGVFVGAIDDTNTFSTVQFWGDGAGEALYAGGKIRYTNAAIGSISNVPEPLTIIGTIVGGTAALRLRKKLKSTNKL